MPIDGPAAMSLKNWLMPSITQWWLSPERQDAARARNERKRLRAGEPHRLHYFHQVDDPYSALMAQCLPQLLERYDVVIEPHVVSPPADDAAPDRVRLQAYSRKDAAWLATRHGLQFTDIGQQPSDTDIATCAALLIAAIQEQRFVADSAAISQALWQGNLSAGPMTTQQTPDVDTVARHVAESDALRLRLGHYNGGMLYSGGEWYWGLDRLHYLEQRLAALGAARAMGTKPMFAPDSVSSWPEGRSGDGVDFFFSLRSPYSAIAAHRLFALTHGTQVQVRLRYVLPMVMRGLPVPKSKRMYISMDAAREARRLGVPFGRICDPLGLPTERGLSIIPLAEARGVGQQYVLSFMQGVWAEGMDAGSDRHLRRITDRAGLSWSDVQAALQDSGWRAVAETNRLEMLSLGLWGVPGLRFNDTVAWGQDRLQTIEMALRNR